MAVRLDKACSEMEGTMIAPKLPQDVSCCQESSSGVNIDVKFGQEQYVTLQGKTRLNANIKLLACTHHTVVIVI